MSFIRGSANVPIFENDFAQEVLHVQKPTSVTVVGSFMLHTITKPNLNVDVQLEIPQVCTCMAVDTAVISLFLLPCVRVRGGCVLACVCWWVCGGEGVVRGGEGVVRGGEGVVRGGVYVRVCLRACLCACVCIYLCQIIRTHALLSHYTYICIHIHSHTYMRTCARDHAFRIGSI